MGSHHPFGHLKHKLWPKEGLGVKLPIWLSTPKSQESTRFLHAQLERSQRGLQLFFRPHCNPRSARKVMAPQSRGSPNLGDFGTPTWEYTIRGKVMAYPQVRVVVGLVCLCCPWLILAPKVLQLCTNHLVLVLCRSMWVSEACQLFLVPSRSSNTPFYPSKVLRTRERDPTPCFSVVFCLGLTFESLKELGVRHMICHNYF